MPSFRSAEKSGAVVWQGAEAVEPLGSESAKGGPALGARVVDHDHGTTSEVRANYVIVADGANSRFGRALGAERDRALPLGMALRGYYYSPRHAEPFIESHLDIRDGSGNVLPGYGWIFPTGDGRVNVGVGLVSTYRGWKDINTSNLLAAFVAHAPKSWCLGPETLCQPATGGRLPMGLSVGPRVGPDYLLVGDASGSVNPFNGEGIAYGYETGRMAAEHIARASAAHDPSLLKEYDVAIEDRYALYFKVASTFMQLMGRPLVMQRLVATGMHSKTAMGWLLRMMSNLLRPDEMGPAELAYRGAAALTTRFG
jgi:flavin-dependent dehydrogenase